MKSTFVTADSQNLHVRAFPGDNKVLLAMSLPEADASAGGRSLAGFAIWRTESGQPEVPLNNRISFTVGVDKTTTAKTRKWTSSEKAPFQKFRWVDVPPRGVRSPIMYRIRAMFFSGNSPSLVPGPEVKITVNPIYQQHSAFKPAFTRGYIASQAYAERFKNADIRPKGAKTDDFDTAPFRAQYEWLGADARTSLFAFIKDCENGGGKVDVFAYDLDEPDVIAAICRMGKAGKLRAILDNAPLHARVVAGKKPIEIDAAKRIIAAAGNANVRQGHFDRFQHNKVFIKRDASGIAQRVLFGSMNFSVRGIYVQANNVIVADDPAVAKWFGDAFDVAFDGNVAAAPFRSNSIALDYHVCSATDTPALPQCRVALSPHTSPMVSLGIMSQRIRAATSSVLFAVMEPNGSGPVLLSLRTIAAEPVVFSYGTVETDKGLAVQTPNGAMGQVTGFASLQRNVPQPFTAEFSGGPGMHIHSKFVVVDFCGTNPTVFTGSSNLAAGGEQDNGDSLMMIEDEDIATIYAIEAVATFDHYHFRSKMKTATKARPFTLWYPGKPADPTPWWKPYYDRTDIRMRDRCLFAGVPLSPGMAAVKTVDWAALDKKAATPAKPKKKAAGGKKKTVRR